MSGLVELETENEPYIVSITTFGDRVITSHDLSDMVFKSRYQHRTEDTFLSATLKETISNGWLLNEKESVTKIILATD